MKVFTKRADLLEHISIIRKNPIQTGFVPTMGALHQGHISLIQHSKNENDITVVSIFVNPTQFNNPDDLKNYPRTVEADILLLSQVEVDILFIPETEEIYSPETNQEVQVDLKDIDKVMEGAFRPGHFKGVVQVVNILFDIVRPDKAYFGEKDYQQLAVIRRLVEDQKIPVTIVPCPTIREESGLAMSSRNMRLSDTEKTESILLFKALEWIRQHKKNLSIKEVLDEATKLIESSGLIKVEYLIVADEDHLMPISNWSQSAHPRVFVAAKIGAVRLIDNMPLWR